MSQDWIKQKLRAIEEQGRLRTLRSLSSPQGPVITLDHKEVINFSSNDYLSLAADPRVIRAAMAAAERFGAGAGSSRLIAGNLALFGRLEEKLAELKGTESSLLFTTGYHANLGLIASLVGPGDAVFSDRLNHASIIDGCRLSRAQIVIYEHADPADLDRKLGEAGDAQKKLVVTESLFSMEGDLAPLPELIRVARKRGAMIVIDDAHATGVLGQSGGGGLEHFGIRADRVTAVMGTLGKALGSSGAFVAGRRVLIDYLINQARAFIFTTAPAPAVAGAALEAIRIMKEEPERKERVLKHADRVRATLVAKGHRLENVIGPILPVIIGESKATMQICDRLLERGLFVQGIRPPTVPEGSARLRISLCAGHTEEQLEKLIGALP